MKTKLSIIIVGFNTAELLAACLDSIGKKYEVIVVDNASTDGSGALLKKSYPWVRLIINKENVGFARANNQGIAVATGEYILLLNPDTEVHGETLPKLINYLDTEPRAGVVTCKVLLPNGTLDDACHRGFPTPWRALTHFTGLGNIFPNSMFFNGYHLGYQHMNQIHEIDACVGAFMLIRRTVGEQLTWLDEDYFWYGEDLDFCYRVKKLGYKVVYIPTVSITHHKGAASGIKKHSQSVSKADLVTKQRATRARFEVMRIFYKKHYQNLYPKWLMSLVFLGIDIKQRITEKAL